MTNLLDVDRSQAGQEAVTGTKLVDARVIPGLQRQQKLLDLYLAVIDSCLHSGVADWWRRAVSLPFGDMTEGLGQLKDLCLQELLYDGGDIAAFCGVYGILEQDGLLADDSNGQFLLELLRFVQPLIRTELPKSPGTMERLFGKKKTPAAAVSLVIPDDQSLANFRELGLPSLAAEDIAALASQREVTLLLCGRQSHLDDLQEFLKGRLDWPILAQAVPDELCDRLAGEDVRRDWLVGAMQCQHLTEARKLGADFLSLNANGVYAAGYFKAVLKAAEGKPAVLTVPLWVNNRGLLDKTMGRRLPTDPAIISPRDLASMGRDVSAPAGCVTFVEGNVTHHGQMADLRVMWVGADRIDIHSTSHEIAFLSADSVRALPNRFFVRPAADVERLLGQGRAPHFVTETDGIVIGQFGHPPGGLVDVAGDAVRFEAVTAPLALRARRGFFRQPVRLSIARNVEVPAVDLASAPGKALHGAFLSAVDDVQSGPKATQILAGLNVLHQYEMSDYGPANMAAAIAEARRLIDLSPTEEPALAGEERKVLIRAAMNFDHVDKAIALAKGGGEGTAFVHAFLAKMMELRAENVAKAHQLRRKFFLRRSFAVVGSIVWGEAFIDKFMNYHVPSMLAAGNIPGLARSRKVIHSIVTTDTDRKRIEAHPVFKRLRRCAEVVFTCFPEKFLEQRERDQYQFYHFYGLLDHQSVFLAAALRAELYLMPVDIVLSHDSMTNLGRRLKRGADSCAVAGIECEPGPLRQWLDGRPRGPNGELDLPPGELMDDAIAMPDAYARSLIMNEENRSFCRHPRELVWPRPDGVFVHSLFMHPVALSARVMSRPFSPHYENVDYALLPRLLQGDADVEVLEDPHELAAAQFGAPAGREEFMDTSFSLEAFVEAHRYNYAVQRRCFAKRQFFPCKKPPYAPSDRHDAEVALIQSALKRYRFTLDDGRAR